MRTVKLFHVSDDKLESTTLLLDEVMNSNNYIYAHFNSEATRIKVAKILGMEIIDNYVNVHIDTYNNRSAKAFEYYLDRGINTISIINLASGRVNKDWKVVANLPQTLKKDLLC